VFAGKTSVVHPRSAKQVPSPFAPPANRGVAHSFWGMFLRARTYIAFTHPAIPVRTVLYVHVASLEIGCHSPCVVAWESVAWRSGRVWPSVAELRAASDVRSSAS
jgi:hypothetical protein